MNIFKVLKLKFVINALLIIQRSFESRYERVSEILINEFILCGLNGTSFYYCRRKLLRKL